MTDVQQSPVIETKKAMEEVAYDDIATYRRKLASYDRHQLEDIYLHIDREAHPERYKAVVEELRRRGCVDDADVLLRGKLEEALEARTGMLGPVALVPVREQQRQP